MLPSVKAGRCDQAIGLFSLVAILGEVSDADSTDPWRPGLIWAGTRCCW